MRVTNILALSALCLSMAGLAHAGERAEASVICNPAETALVFTCEIMVEGRKSGQAVEAEELIVKADMPSMPMAHNVPPAQALPVEGQPGLYTTTLELEMFGEWALAIDVDGVLAGTDQRVRDKVVVKHSFGDEHAMEMEQDGHQHGSDGAGSE